MSSCSVLANINILSSPAKTRTKNSMNYRIHNYKNILGPVSQRKNISPWTVLVKGIGIERKFGSFGGCTCTVFLFWRTIRIGRFIWSRTGNRAILWSDTARYMRLMLIEIRTWTIFTLVTVSDNYIQWFLSVSSSMNNFFVKLPCFHWWTINSACIFCWWFYNIICNYACMKTRMAVIF